MPERTIPLDVRSLMLRALLDTRRLYLGLSDSEAIDGAPLLLLESGELETDGYRRQAIEPASWTIAPDGEAVVARVVNTAFVNVGTQMDTIMRHLQANSPEIHAEIAKAQHD